MRLQPRAGVPVRRLILCLAVALSACSDGGGPTDAGPDPSTRIQQLAGDNQQGPPGRLLADSLVVQALDGAGKGQGGVTVRFAVTAGGGAISPATVTTAADGTARASWLLGPGEGAQTATASVEGASGASVPLKATASYGAEARIEAVSGAGQAVPVGCALASPLVVRVTDAGGRPVPGARVYFVPEGASQSAALVSVADAEGRARAAWAPRDASTGRVVASIGSRQPASVSFDVRAVPVAPNGYATIGNRIVSAGCRTHRFFGVARPGLQYWPDDARLSNAAQAAEEFAAMKSWGFNVVRLPVYQRFWQRDFVTADRTYRKEAYQALVDATIQRINAAGLDVILDLHASDRGDPNHPDSIAQIQQMADEANSIRFWQEAARKYKDNGRVVFQLYNEPNQISWEVWRNGGQIPGQAISSRTCPIAGSVQSCGAPFRAAGYQQLYNAVRAEGADNLVIVNGMHWGYDLSRVPEYAIQGQNIVYATHPYDYPDKQPAAWDAAWGLVADRFPVMIAEFGDYVCNRNGYYTAVLDYADRKQLSWVAWAWWAPPANRQDLVCGYPALVTDWTGTPSPSGQAIRSRLQSYR